MIRRHWERDRERERLEFIITRFVKLSCR